MRGEGVMLRYNYFDFVWSRPLEYFAIIYNTVTVFVYSM